MPEIKQMPREYGEMIYSLLTEMNGALMAQSRAINNNLSNTQRTMLDLQVSINNLIMGLKETRDKRYQEEIEILERQVQNFTKQLEEKKVAKISNGDTSEKIRSVALDVITQREQSEQKRKQIDWIDVRNKVLIVVVTAIVFYSIPQIGHLLQVIFAPK
jgi:hypothetical protein